MKLYYSPGACSLSCHIALQEGGIAHELVKVNLRAHETEDGRDYYTINPNGSVPALETDGGDVITQNAAILQYLGDNFAPAIVPANATLARARLQEMLGFIGADYHKAYSPLFNPAATEEAKTAQKEIIARRQAWLEGLLADGRSFILGNEFTVADAYLFTVTNWSGRLGLSLDAFPHLIAYMERMRSRPSVVAAMKAEGLIH